MDVAVIDAGVPGDFGMVCHRKKQRRRRQKILIIDLFLDFAKNTTLHGLRYITEKGLTAVEKIFWITTFVISVILCFLLIERVWHKWWYSPVIVSFNERMVSVSELPTLIVGEKVKAHVSNILKIGPNYLKQYWSKVPFPSITICPQWKFVANEKSPYNYSSLYKKCNSKKKTQRFEEEIEMKFDDATLTCDYSSDRYNNHCTPRNMSDVSVVNNIDEISPTLRMVFYQCQWRNHIYPCRDMFKKVYTSEGVCFNFNSVNHSRMFKQDSIQKDYLYFDPTPTKWTKKFGSKSVRGQENGSKPDLRLILAESPVQNDEMCNSLSNGFKIYLQHPHDMPQASLYYYAAIEGQVSSLAVKFSVFNTSRRLEGYTAEQRQCYFDGNRELQYFKKYTYNNCRLECLSLYTYEKCGCVWFHMPHSNSSEICTARKKKCVLTAQDDLATNNLVVDMGDRCNCLPRCESIQYDAEILKTNFDLKKFVKANRKINELPETQNYLYNYSKIEMYFKESRFVSMRRSELFGLTDFLANCGGLLGLFLGFSFLSLVEVFYFCTLRLWCTLKKDIKFEKKRLRESMYQKTS